MSIGYRLRNHGGVLRSRLHVRPYLGSDISNQPRTGLLYLWRRGGDDFGPHRRQKAVTVTRDGFLIQRIVSLSLAPATPGALQQCSGYPLGLQIGTAALVEIAIAWADAVDVVGRVAVVSIGVLP
jgi:hypothetical protein